MKRVVSREQVAKIKAAKAAGLLTTREIADGLGLSYMNVWQCVTGNTHADTRQQKPGQQYRRLTDQQGQQVRREWLAGAQDHVARRELSHVWMISDRTLYNIICGREKWAFLDESS